MTEYKETIDSILMMMIIIIVFHILIYVSIGNGKYDFGLSGKIFNGNFINTICFLIISYLSYDLVFKEIYNFLI